MRAARSAASTGGISQECAPRTFQFYSCDKPTRSTLFLYGNSTTPFAVCLNETAVVHVSSMAHMAHCCAGNLPITAIFPHRNASRRQFLCRKVALIGNFSTVQQCTVHLIYCDVTNQLHSAPYGSSPVHVADKHFVVHFMLCVSTM